MRDMFKTAVYGVCEEQMIYAEESSSFWEYILPFTRFWGLFSAVVLCGVGVDITLHKHDIGLFYILCAVITFFLELSWVVTLFLQICIRNEYSTCLSCWSYVLWFRLWKRSLLYVAFAVILFLRPHRLWLSIVAGLQLMVLSGLYLILTYRTCNTTKLIPSPRLLNSHSPSQDDNYDKYEETGEVLDDTLPTPLLNDNLSELEQDTILEL